MTQVHTAVLPKHQGERDLAHQLQTIDDTRIHLWFGLDFIPGVQDIDIFLIHQDIGAFVIEVKAVPIDMVESIGFHRCKITGRKDSISPTVQAYRAFESLMEYLNPRIGKLPFITATAAWPKISRYQWSSRWDNQEISGDWNKSMLFEEDIFASTRLFVERLHFVRTKPPIRGGSKAQTVTNSEVETISRALDPLARPKPTQSDFQRLQAIERGYSAKLKRDFPSDDRRHAVFTGHPGTGKTFRLEQIGLSHAYDEKRVLFVCFNKVLAADIRRLLSMHEKLNLTEEGIEVMDVYRLASRYSNLLGLSLDQSMDYDEWGDLVTEGVMELDERERSHYDTILIDEAQDMTEWQLELISCLAHHKTTICVAVGTGQELYGSPDGASSWIRKFIEAGAQERKLRRNFRNTRVGYLLAKCFYEAFPSQDKILKSVSSPQGSGTQEQIEIERSGGSLPKQIIFDETSLPIVSDPAYPFLQEELMVSECLRVIEQEFERLDSNDEPIDLIILVPDTKGGYAKWVTMALNQFKKKTSVGFTNYLENRNRRNVPPNEKVRLVTFHSSRGLEGNRVLIFGFDRIEPLCEAIDIDIHKLGYIVLSRALFDTTLAMRSLTSTQVNSFIQNSLYTIQRHVDS